MPPFLCPPHRPLRVSTLIQLTLHLILLTALPPARCLSPATSTSPARAFPELLDSPLQVDAPATHATHKTEQATNVQSDDGDADERKKRSSEGDATQGADKTRVKTGDTILNIRGAVRDSIGDAGAASGARRSSRLDAFVIRPAHAHTHRLPLNDQPVQTQQAPVNDRELLVEAHSRVRIPCDLKDVSDLRWYKDNDMVLLGAVGVGDVWREEGGGSAAVLARASRADAGLWRCAGTDGAGRLVSGKPTTLLIYEPVRSVYLAVDGRRLDAGNTWVPVRDKTMLEVRCVAEGGVPPPELSWRLLASEPGLDHRPYLRILPTNYSVEGVWWSHAVVTAARELHNASLRCDARQRRPASAPASVPSSVPATAPAPVPTPPPVVMAAKLQIHVTYPPSFVISRWPGFGVSLVEGGAAALRCDVDANPPARAWWLRDDHHATSSPPPTEGSGGGAGSATLRWAALGAAHAGWYRCRAAWLDTQYSSIGYYLNVLAPEVNTERATDPPTTVDEADHQKVEVPLGGNVQLNCPKGSVGCWWRRVVGNASENWAPAGSHHAHGVLGIKDALYQEGGEYRCLGARAPDLQRLRELKRVTVKVTGAATATALSAEPAVAGASGAGWKLVCGVCGRGVRAVWVVEGRALAATLQPDASPHCWRTELLTSDTSELWCVASSALGGAVAVFPPRPARTHTARRTNARAHTHTHTLLAALLPVLTVQLSRHNDN